MDTKELEKVLLNAPMAKRDAWFELLKKPVFKPVFNFPSWEETRDDPYRKLKAVCDAKLLSVKDFGRDPRNIFLAHEFLGMIDPNAAVKFTAHFNLFGGTVFGLGTERHEHLHDKIDDLSLFGCFALTELGYGNNAVKMETEAVYDAKTDEFVVSTPTQRSTKYWISNGFRHATSSLVFAQLFVAGKHEGVHAFLVPIRDEKTMAPMPGVTIVDMGVKFGLNGIDNATLRYVDVRIPRANMLNRYGDVDANGVYQNEVKNKGPARFFQVSERLLSGRVCIASVGLGVAKACLYIAITYAQQRKSIGPEGDSSVPIFDYQLQ